MRSVVQKVGERTEEMRSEVKEEEMVDEEMRADMEG